MKPNETFDEMMNRFDAARKTPLKDSDDGKLFAALRKLARQANSAEELIQLADADGRFEPGRTKISGTSEWKLTPEELNDPSNSSVYLAGGQMVEGMTQHYSYAHCVNF